MERACRDRWITAAAWAAFLAIFAFVAWRNSDGGGASSAAAVQWEITARAALGTRALLPSSNVSVRQIVDDLDSGGVPLRQRAAVLTGETEGAAAAHVRLFATRTQAQAAGGETAEVQRVLETLYPRAPSSGETQAQRVDLLSADDRASLVKSLGWFGRLALAPEGGDADARGAVLSAARRTAVVNVAVLGLACTVIPAGVVLLVVALVLRLRGRFTFRHDVTAGDRSFGAETFAAYVGVYLALAYAARDLMPAEARWASTIGAQLLSLVALGVPVLRGLPWAKLRRRLGLDRGAGLAREIGAGVLGWIAGAPVLAGGFLVMLLMQKVLHHARAPGEGAHPISTFLSAASPGDAVLIAVAAAVMAPLVEETMFRGVLYRHLRESTAGWPRVASVLVSAVAGALLFAAIHPQGWTAIPVLGAMAFSFAIVREWRGSLVAPMVMHAMTNTMSVVLVQVALSS